MQWKQLKIYANGFKKIHFIQSDPSKNKKYREEKKSKNTRYSLDKFSRFTRFNKNHVAEKRLDASGTHLHRRKKYLTGQSEE